MTKLTRRHLLTGLTATPYLLRSCVAASEGSQAKAAPVVKIDRLTVYFHGLFVFLVMQDRIEALAPRGLAGHVPMAGEGLGSPIAGQPYTLIGSNWADILSTKPIEYPVLRKPGLIVDRRNVEFSVLMPLPNAIKSLRSIDRDPKKGEFLIGSHAPGTYPLTQAPEKLPLLVAFVYENLNANPGLFPGGWGYSGTKKKVHLHVRYESPDGNHMGDPFVYIRTMLKLAGPDLNLNPSYMNATQCSDNNEPDFPEEEQKSLCEINQECECPPKQSRLVAVRPPNCLSFFLYPM